MNVDLQAAVGAPPAVRPLDPYDPQQLKQDDGQPPPPPPKGDQGRFVDHLGHLMPAGWAPGPQADGAPIPRAQDLLAALPAAPPAWMVPSAPDEDPTRRLLGLLESGALVAQAPQGQGAIAPVVPHEAPVPLSALPGVVAAHVRATPPGQGPSTISLQIDPVHLGRVQVDVSWHQGQVSVALTAQQASHAALEDHLPAIRQILAEHRLPTADLTVVAAAAAGAGMGNPGGQPGSSGSGAGTGGGANQERRGSRQEGEGLRTPALGEAGPRRKRDPGMTLDVEVEV